MKLNNIIFLLLAFPLVSWTPLKNSNFSGACLLQVYNNLSITVDDVYIDSDVNYCHFGSFAANTYQVSEISWDNDALEIDVFINNQPKNFTGHINIYNGTTLVTSIPMNSSTHAYVYQLYNPAGVVKVYIDPY